ncbi:MAG: helix-turn-helix transcriptional regulator [Solirubrobacteraceae bacterium]|nr:helix-turn-helix transcriptional regulator [Solirubrobacteraceae bacterium]
MRRAQEDENRRLLRARDAIDRSYDQPLDTAALAAIAMVSEAHFIRRFKAVFGETPGRYLQRRRIERAMSLLRTADLTVGEICVEVGFASVATFTRSFKEIVGETPSTFRDRGPGVAPYVPTCFEKAWTRPSSAVSRR